MAPDDRIETESKRAAAGIPAGKGGTVVAYVGGVPVGCGVVTMTDDGWRASGSALSCNRRGDRVSTGRSWLPA